MSNKDIYKFIAELEEQKASAVRVDRMIKIRINSFLDLKEDWDSYGAKVIEKATTDRAIEFYEHVREQIPHLPEPFVCPDCNGGMHFTWSIPNSKLYKYTFAVELPEDKSKRYQWMETEREQDEETIRKYGSLESMSRLMKILKDWAGEGPKGGFQ